MGCYVPGCPNAGKRSDPSVSFHRVPTTSVALYKQWIGAIRRSPTEAAAQDRKICSLHFAEADLLRRDAGRNRQRLRRGALPTRALPDPAAIFVRRFRLPPPVLSRPSGEEIAAFSDEEGLDRAFSEAVQSVLLTRGLAEAVSGLEEARLEESEQSSQLELISSMHSYSKASPEAGLLSVASNDDSSILKMNEEVKRLEKKCNQSKTKIDYLTSKLVYLEAKCKCTERDT